MRKRFRIVETTSALYEFRVTAMAPQKIRLLIVDDHPILRRGLVDLFEESGIAVVGQAATSADALRIGLDTKPDVAVVDLMLGNEDGVSLIAEFVKRLPGVAILVLSSCDERVYAARAIHAGARGYIRKDRQGDELVTAVRHVAGGGTYVSEGALEKVLAGMGPGSGAGTSPLERLSDRERHVFVLLGSGLSTKEIAVQLNVSVKTVETHCAHLKEKLGARSSRELARVAFVWAGRP